MIPNRKDELFAEALLLWLRDEGLNGVMLESDKQLLVVVLKGKNILP